MQEQEIVQSSYASIINSDDPSRIVLIIGKSGLGKSYSIRNLPAKNTFVVNIFGKELPFKGWKKNYTIWKPGTRTGNMLRSNNYSDIDFALDEIKHRKEIKFGVIDDFQYLMTGEFMDRAYEKGYDKWTEMGKHVHDIIMKAKTLGGGKTIFFLAHSETNDLGEIDVKTLGKLLSEKIVIAGMFTVVLMCQIDKGEFKFQTKNRTGKSIVKSPPGMFPDELIDNDLNYVAKKIYEYDN